MLFIASCGSTAAPDETPAAPTSTKAADRTDDTDASSDGANRLELQDPDWDSLEEWHVPAGGGLTFGAPTGARVLPWGNLVRISPPEESAEHVGAVLVGLVEMNDINQPTSLEEFMELSGLGTSEPTGQVLDFDGMQLTGYKFRLNEDLPTDGYYPLWQSGVAPFPASGTGWGPFPQSEFFIGEVPRGVLAMGYLAETEEELPAARKLFEQIAPTLQFHVPLQSEAASEPPAPIEHPAPLPYPTEVALPAGAAEEMPVNFQFSIAEAGTWSFATLGSPAELTLKQEYDLLLNAAGWTIMSNGTDRFAPDSMRLDFRTGLDLVVPTALHEGPVGPAIDTTNLTSLLEDPPANLIVEQGSPITIDGAEVATFNFEVDRTAECVSDSPCEFWFLSAYSLQLGDHYDVRVGRKYRIWQLDGPVEPLTILIQSYDEAGLDEFQEVVETLRFLP